MVKRGVAVFFFLFCLALAQCTLAARNAIATAAAASSPPSGSGKTDDKLQKCISSYRATAGTCYYEFYASIWKGKVSVGADCCKAIAGTDSDCASYMAYGFNNPFLHLLLKEHCASKA